MMTVETNSPSSQAILAGRGNQKGYLSYVMFAKALGMTDEAIQKNWEASVKKHEQDIRERFGHKDDQSKS